MTPDGIKSVLYVESNLDGTVGGSYYSLLYLVSALDRSRYRPVVLFESACRIADKFAAVSAAVIQCKPFVPLKRREGLLRLVVRGLNGSRNLLRKPLTLYRCLRILRQHHIGLVHLNNGIRIGWCWLFASRLLGIPCITHQRGMEDRSSATSRFMARRFAAVICISKAVRENLLSVGVRDVPLPMIHNAIDIQNMRPDRLASEIKEQLGIADRHPVVGMVGNVQRWKGQHVLIAAIAELRKSMPMIACVFVGDVSKTIDDIQFAEELKATVTKSGLQHHIVMAGYRADVANYVNAFDAVVHASIRPEPFGRVLLEAMALSKPVVASRAGGVPEIIVDGQSGLLFEPGDAAALTAALSRVLGDAATAARLGAAGHARLLEEFSISAHVQRVQEVYGVALGESAGHS